MTSKITSQLAEQPVFDEVAENLDRLESSDGYYALLKLGGKQFRQPRGRAAEIIFERPTPDLVVVVLEGVQDF